MKRFLLALAVTGISANAWAAADIGNDHQCSQLTTYDKDKACEGYNKSPSECYGVPTLFCPFDTNLVFCGHKTECEVGDVLYSDGHCYGDLPVPKKTSASNSETIDAVAVIVDPNTRLAVLAYGYATGLAWQLPNARMANNDVCANSGESYSDDMVSAFPSREYIQGCTSCGVGCPVGSQTTFNWDVTPLLQKILNPLNNFTPIKSAWADNVTDQCINSRGCAIPLVATSQTGCTTSSGQNVGGRFYTQKLMEFQKANSGITFKIINGNQESTVTGIQFPAAAYCNSLTDISVGGKSVTPFLPSVADLYKMLDIDSGNIYKIYRGLLKSLSGNTFSYDDEDSMSAFMEHLEDNQFYNDVAFNYRQNLTVAGKGFWSSQQFYHSFGGGDSCGIPYTSWNRASAVTLVRSYSSETEEYSYSLAVTPFSAYQHEYGRDYSQSVYCFINY